MTVVIGQFKFSQIWEATTAKRMNPYCQRQSCSPPMYFLQRCIDYIDVAGRSSAMGIIWVYNQNTVSENGDFQPLLRKNVLQTVRNTARPMVTINHQ